ncbi:MAG TPA: hypothetical protein VFF88_05005 [Methylocella sp.]|nr:hypothetical protein [Methylocella sp.]
MRAIERLAGPGEASCARHRPFFGIAHAVLSLTRFADVGRLTKQLSAAQPEGSLSRGSCPP